MAWFISLALSHDACKVPGIAECVAGTRQQDECSSQGAAAQTHLCTVGEQRHAEASAANGAYQHCRARQQLQLLLPCTCMPRNRTAGTSNSQQFAAWNRKGVRKKGSTAGHNKKPKSRRALDAKIVTTVSWPYAMGYRTNEGTNWSHKSNLRSLTVLNTQPREAFSFGSLLTCQLRDAFVPNFSIWKLLS